MTDGRRLQVAMNWSLAVGVAMLVAKWIAWSLTGSSVIFSDAAESVVHIIAVWFAWYALRITQKPPDEDHPYGHDKIGYVSAGVEGGLICIAAIVIIITAVEKLLVGVTLERLDIGMSITAACGGINAILGYYLIRSGKRHANIVVEANGRHVMTDVWTSLGAVAGLLAAWATDILWIDPVMAILFGANIIREGVNLVSTSVRGLMDTADPALLRRATDILEHACSDGQCSYHRLRLRTSGNRIHIDYHLQVADDMTMIDAHSLATRLEDQMRDAFGIGAEVFTHLESQTQPDGHE
ncbi:MAG TPA: cation diffusion facilitator family transporter [Chlorobiota bacterium]|nr:cation diffusion facilitator family transporter [Chlorobiota bacterium]